MSQQPTPNGGQAMPPRRPTNPYTDPAQGIELTLRERQALMSEDDWAELVDRELER